MKKVFIASSVLLGVLLIFWGIYNFAFKPSTSKKTNIPSAVDQQPVVPKVLENQALDGKIKDLSNEGVISPVLKEENNKILFYSSLDGRAFSINFDGSGKSVFSSQALPGFFDAIWSPDRKKVISEFDQGARKYFYDYEVKSGKQLNGAVNNPVWSNLGDKILYQYLNGKSNELDIANPDGSGWKKITNIRAPKAKIAPIPQTSLVTFWNYPRSSEETSLLSVGLLGGEVKKISGGKFGADYLWAPDGKKGLVSFVEQKNGPRMEVGIMDYDGLNFRDLSIPTLVSKCTWSRDGKSVFYALPGDVPTDAVMPDDYQNRKFNTKDTFWKVNLATGEKTRLIELEELGKIGVGFDATNLFLDPSESFLFFVNRVDGHLYRLELNSKS